MPLYTALTSPRPSCSSTRKQSGSGFCGGHFSIPGFSRHCGAAPQWMQCCPARGRHTVACPGVAHMGQGPLCLKSSFLAVWSPLEPCVESHSRSERPCDVRMWRALLATHIGGDKLHGLLCGADHALIWLTFAGSGDMLCFLKMWPNFYFPCEAVCSIRTAS